MNAEKISAAGRLLGALSVAEIAREPGVKRGTLYSNLYAIEAAGKQPSHA